MEIVSQDKATVLVCRAHEVFSGGKTIYRMPPQYDKNKEVLGRYATNKRALAVVEEIQATRKLVFEMPKK